MANLLSLPENVVIQHLFPLLGHNDVLRLRRVSKETKAWAETYLWMPKRGNQGKWELKIGSGRNGKTLQDFLQLNLPPPSQLYIANKAQKEVSEQGSFYENDRLEEFMDRYSKYVTKLTVEKLFFPFTSPKEIAFYESLTNLENLRAHSIITVGGDAEFEKKTRNAEGSFLIRPTFEKLKTLNLRSTDCLDSMWNFINGVSENLQEIEHPFKKSGEADDSVTNALAPVQELIERRGVKKLVYDWNQFCHAMSEPLDLLKCFAACRERGVMIKNLQGCTLHCLLCDENGTIDKTEVWDWATNEMVYRVNYRRNLFVGSIIQSMLAVVNASFLLDMPALENITIRSADCCRLRILQNRRFPEWPNLKVMDFHVDEHTEEHLHFFCGRMILPNLEELSLNYYGSFRKMKKMPFPRSSSLVNCFQNLKKLRLNFCPGDTNFFLGLWKGLVLLEELTLENCFNLSDRCFIGYGDTPVFLRLEKLRHLSIGDVQDEWYPLTDELSIVFTDEVFLKVFRHMKLSSFTLRIGNPSFTLKGIESLLTGQFAETIEKLDFNRMYYHDASMEQQNELESRFRSSKML